MKLEKGNTELWWISLYTRKNNKNKTLAANIYLATVVYDGALWIYEGYIFISIF